jgi:hypothetical protein
MFATNLLNEPELKHLNPIATAMSKARKFLYGGFEALSKD